MKVIAYKAGELDGVRYPEPRAQPCDGCQAGTPAYRYPAADCGLGTVVYGTTVMTAISLGAWQVCPDCSELIEAGDWPALARRTLASLALDLSRCGPGVRVRLLAQIHSAQEQFRKARSGPREVWR